MHGEPVTTSNRTGVIACTKLTNLKHHYEKLILSQRKLYLCNQRDLSLSVVTTTK